MLATSSSIFSRESMKPATETEKFTMAKFFFGEEDAQKFIKFAKEAGNNWMF